VLYLSMALDRWEPRVVARTEESGLVPAAGDESTDRVHLYYQPTENRGADTASTSYEDTYQEATL